MYPFGHVGIALATSLSSWLNAILLAFILNKRKQLILDDRFYYRVPRIIFSSAVMGGVVFLSLKYFLSEFGIFYDINNPMLIDEFRRTLLLILLILIGLISYASSLILTGGLNMNEFKNLTARNK